MAFIYLGFKISTGGVPFVSSYFVKEISKKIVFKFSATLSQVKLAYLMGV